MKPIERDEILGIAEYEQIRERFRARVVQEKRVRRVAVGPDATAVFENRDTVMMQIQEMLRTERITKEAGIRHEIETYNQLVPGKNELSCTLMIEIVDTAARDRFLAAARGFERHVALVIDGERAPAVWEKHRELPDRTSAVHYLRFPLSEKAAAALRDPTASNHTAVDLVVDHPMYRASTRLRPETVASLAEDLLEP